MLWKVIKTTLFATTLTGIGIIAGLAWRDAQLVGPVNYVQSEQSKAVFAAFEALQAGERDRALELISDRSLDDTQSCWELARGGRFCKALKLTRSNVFFEAYLPSIEGQIQHYLQGITDFRTDYQEVRICVPDDPNLSAIGIKMEGRSSGGLDTAILLNHAWELRGLMNHPGFRMERLYYSYRDQSPRLETGPSITETLPENANSSDIFRGALWDYSASVVSYQEGPYGASIWGIFPPPTGPEDGCLSPA